MESKTLHFRPRIRETNEKNVEVELKGYQRFFFRELPGLDQHSLPNKLTSSYRFEIHRESVLFVR